MTRPLLLAALALLLAAAPAPASPADPTDGQTWQAPGIELGGTRDGDAMAGAASAFRQVAQAWRSNDTGRANVALALGRRWLLAVHRPEAAALDERASRLAHAIAMRDIDVAAGAEVLARDAGILCERYGGAVTLPWATTVPTRTPTPRPRVVAPAGAPTAPLRRPPGMYVPAGPTPGHG